ncbi:gfo/Idh/MocA family oxidoreductase [Verminephrobacter aporrectodeae subsp. tuberculatae]|uniref:Gfo/Idh/MocA family oxidoreductase n=1 Tax=Verminephrobacter aporrectodeae subsp. tuberculatae TaxID=1110392 RepID=A0ABT3KRZ9_9BURK|nr:Gfo/Idh/MocA family oxidoreductase [Verminephrobacter aporrectodeae]MCW5220149.1 gfo/Idh/MocA family oxidoreductase [Verminephrobacter aporrectodeae subsp. tuberculatae]MCW5289437.1 gfo/Idh/MocA family oxidoreductase [Verminephrobacter aporrectodeae subsp. tuberculatae]MCW5320902.1 gfo/Idh/MocA family oxidoreductase [Verminephrobacter aporrectodeae subsp. tuberculatae]
MSAAHGAAPPGRRIRLGMVGGGEGAFIGAVHRIAARLDDEYELLAGALSASPEKALRSAQALGLARAYPDYATMARAEAARADGIEAVAIVTPNDQHAPVAEAFLAAGMHVICDKPVSTTLAQALRLQELARARGRILAVTYNYSGYPMVRHARRMLRDGALGTLRMVHVEYLQDWLTEALEETGQKQALWRTDPARAGAGGCIGDIGTHAYQLAAFVTGLKTHSLCAELSRFVPNRALDDDAQILLRYVGGARGMLWASQVAPGNANELRLRVYGSKGGIEWSQELPNQLHWSPFGQPTQKIERGTAAANADAARVTRLPAGHPEGYLEGFASVYTEIAQALRAARNGAAVPKELSFPDITDGVHGMAFIEAAMRSSRQGGEWVGVGVDEAL